MRAIKYLKKNKCIRYVYNHTICYYNNLLSKLYRHYFNKKYEQCINKVKNKTKIKVSFLVSSISQWKCQSIYSEFLKDTTYEVTIYVVAENANDPDTKKELNKTLEVFKENKINAIDAFSDSLKEKQHYQEIKKSDIVFFSRRSDWNGPLSLKKFTKSLTCYVPYSIHTDLNHYLQYGTIFHQCLWRHYLPNDEFKEFAKTIYPANNCVVTGYSGLDPFINHTLILCDKDNPTWNNTERLKVIWAPHHSIEKGNHWPFFSTFLAYADQMLYLAEKSEKFEICLKPHPALKQKLYKHAEWGPEKTDRYYSNWVNASNCHLHESTYHDLFLTADAMILDSVSFLSEFSFLKKPICFLTREDKGTYEKYFNSVGYRIFKLVDKAKSWNEINHFLNNIAFDKSMHNKNSKIELENLYSNSDSQLVAGNVIRDVGKLSDGI